ncbi:MAG: response regulator transcription factor [Verrucomicrobiota bacterium]
MKNKKFKILLVDDHPIVRERLAELINQQADLVVTGDCGDAAECWQLIANQLPDLAMVDLSLKTTPGLDLIKDLQSRYPKLPVLVLTMHDEVLYAERALRAGARGYVTKQEDTPVILTAIRRVLAGELFVSELLARQLVGALINGSGTGADQHAVFLKQLTDRELEVFQLLGQDRTTRQIAERLRIDIKTVETYQARLKEKCQVTSLNDLRRYAVAVRENPTKKSG